MITTSHSWDDARIYDLESLGLARQGVKVQVFGMLGSSGPTCDYHGVDVIVQPGLKSRFGRFLLNPLRAYLYACAHRDDFDVVHFHDPEFLPYGVLLKWWTKKPVIYDMHEFLPDILTTRQWVPRPLRRALSLIAGLIERVCVHRTGSVVAMNEVGQARGQALGAAHVMAFLAVPEREFASMFDSFDPSRKDILYIGGVSADRGAATIRSLAPRLHARDGVHVVVAGPLQDDEAKRLPDVAGVKYMGVVDRAGIKSLLGAASIGWVPLKHTPNHDKAWAMKIGEYMAAGLPIVTSDLDYSARVVDHYQCGIVVPADEPEAHLKALEYLIENRDAAKRMGENGRQAVLNDFNRDVFAARLAHFYDELVEAAV